MSIVIVRTAKYECLVEIGGKLSPTKLKSSGNAVFPMGAGNKNHGLARGFPPFGLYY
jgi:hypothetical protein